jgi:hypothetical protein
MRQKRATFSTGEKFSAMFWGSGLVHTDGRKIDENAFEAQKKWFGNFLRLRES